MEYPTLQQFLDELLEAGVHKAEAKILNSTSHFAILRPTLDDGRVIACYIDDTEPFWAVTAVRSVVGRER